MLKVCKHVTPAGCLSRPSCLPVKPVLVQVEAVVAIPVAGSEFRNTDAQHAAVTTGATRMNNISTQPCKASMCGHATFLPVKTLLVEA